MKLRLKEILQPPNAFKKLTNLPNLTIGSGCLALDLQLRERRVQTVATGSLTPKLRLLRRRWFGGRSGRTLLLLILVALVVFVILVARFIIFHMQLHGSSLDGIGILGAFVSGQGADHHVQPTSQELGRSVGMAKGRHFFDESLDRFESKLLVGHFAAAEFERDLDLHVFAQEIDPARHFYAKIVGVDGGTKLDFLDAVGVLMFFGILVLFGNLITKFSIIDNPAHGRHRVGGDLHQIDAVLAGIVQRLCCGQDTELTAIDSYDSHFPGTDLAVNPIECGGCRKASRREGTTQDGPPG